MSCFCFFCHSAQQSLQISAADLLSELGRYRCVAERLALLPTACAFEFVAKKSHVICRPNISRQVPPSRLADRVPGSINIAVEWGRNRSFKNPATASTATCLLL